MERETNGTYCVWAIRGGRRIIGRMRQDSPRRRPRPPTPSARVREGLEEVGASYQNGGWDWDRSTQKGLEVGDVKTEKLPEEMKRSLVDERKEYIRQEKTL